MNKNEETIKQLESFLNQSRVVTHKDLKENIDLFLGLLKELRVRLQTEISESGKLKDERIVLLEKTIAKSEANIVKQLNNFQNKNKTDVESYFNLLKKEISRVEKSIPKLPEKDDSSQIENKIEETISRLESLEKDDECEKLEENFNETISDLRDEVYSKLELLRKDLSGKAISRGPIFGKTNIKVLNNGVVVSDVVTELNFTNATSINTSGGTSRRVNIQMLKAYAYKETPTGAINGTNTTYTLTYTPVSDTGTLIVNRSLFVEGVDYTVTRSTKTITMTTALNTNDYPPSFPFVFQYVTTDTVASTGDYDSSFSSAFN